jgi:soluble lytic murein transglycosylase
MTARTTRSTRAPARRSRSAPARPRVSRAAKARAERRRRYLRIAAVLVAGGLAIFGLTRLDFFQEKLRDAFTLPLRHDDIIRQQADEKGVDADLIAAVIYAESRFEDQTSDAGARGLMQITPDTADTIEHLSGGTTFEYSDLADPELNIRYGTFYLRYLLDRYDGNVVAALAAYHAGPGNADAWGGAGLEIGAIPYDDTRAYVEEVLDKRADYRRYYSDELGL